MFIVARTMLSLSLVSFSLRALSTVYVVRGCVGGCLCSFRSCTAHSRPRCVIVCVCSIAELSKFNLFDFTIAIQSDESNAFRVQPSTFPDVRVAEPTQSCVSVRFHSAFDSSVSLRLACLPVPTFAPPGSSTRQMPIVWLRLTANNMLTRVCGI